MYVCDLSFYVPPSSGLVSERSEQLRLRTYAYVDARCARSPSRSLAVQYNPFYHA